MRALRALIAAALATGTVLLAAPQARKGLEWRPEKDRGLALLEDGVPLWVLHFGAEDNWPYFHPLRLPGGPTMTGLSPKDHPWHRALWFSWKFINGTNFWEFRDLKDPRSEPAGRTESIGDEEVNTTDRGAAIVLTIDYRRGTEVLLKEKRRVEIEMPRPDGSYAIDWDMTFAPGGGDVELGKDTDYAGLFFRAAADWKEPRYLNSEGRTLMDVHQAPAAWIDLSGVIDREFGPLGIAILAHPGNPRFPAPWWRDRSRDDDEIAYVGTALLFPGPITLKRGSTLNLRYRVYVHKGYGEIKALDGEFARFSRKR
jgi:hypothetical protein